RGATAGGAGAVRGRSAERTVEWAIAGAERRSVEPVWAYGNDHLVTGGTGAGSRSKTGETDRADGSVCAGRKPGAGAGGGKGRIIYRRERGGAWLLWERGADGRAFRAAPVEPSGWGAVISDRRRVSVPERWGIGVCGARR